MIGSPFLWNPVALGNDRQPGSPLMGGGSITGGYNIGGAPTYQQPFQTVYDIPKSPGAPPSQPVQQPNPLAPQSPQAPSQQQPTQSLSQLGNNVQQSAPQPSQYAPLANMNQSMWSMTGNIGQSPMPQNAFVNQPQFYGALPQWNGGGNGF